MNTKESWRWKLERKKISQGSLKKQKDEDEKSSEFKELFLGMVLRRQSSAPERRKNPQSA